MTNCTPGTKDMNQAEPQAYLTLTELKADLAVVDVSAAKLETLGFRALDGAALAKQADDPVLAKKLRSSKVYRVSDLPRIRAAIARAMNCAAGESFVVGNLISLAPKYLPAGYSMTLQSSPAGHTLSLQYPDGKTVPVNCTPPISSCIKSAIECARADAAIQRKHEKNGAQ